VRGSAVSPSAVVGVHGGTIVDQEGIVVDG
jgi:hypothetical protein